MTDGNKAYCNRGDTSEAVLLDIETSGLNETRDRVIRVSAEKFLGGKAAENFFSFVALDGALSREVEALTGISNEMLAGAPDLDTVMKDLKAFCGDLPVYADNAPFVRKFLKKYDLKILEREHSPVSQRRFDTLIDGAADPLIALCAADVEHIREMYSFCEMKIVRAGEGAELVSRIGEVAAEPYDAFVILLRIPRDALEETVRQIEVYGKTALLGAVEADRFEAVVGCYKARETKGEGK